MGDVREGTNYEVLGGMRHAREMQLLAQHRTWLATKLILRSWQRATATGRLSASDNHAVEVEQLTTLNSWLVAERRQDAKLLRSKGHRRGSSKCHRVPNIIREWGYDEWNLRYEDEDCDISVRASHR